MSEPVVPRSSDNPSSGEGERVSRAEAASQRLELSESSRRAEGASAQVKIDAFVAEARRRGIEPVPLKATTFAGRVVKTDKTGWYIRRNKSIAIGTDGGYYVLTVGGGGLLDAFRGVKLEPTTPPLVVGRGGRDGETGDLQDFLDRALNREV